MSVFAALLRVQLAHRHDEQDGLVAPLRAALLFGKSLQRNGHLLLHRLVVGHPLRRAQSKTVPPPPSRISSTPRFSPVCVSVYVSSTVSMLGWYTTGVFTSRSASASWMRVLVDHPAVRRFAVRAVGRGRGIDAQDGLWAHLFQRGVPFRRGRVVRLVVEQREFGPVHQTRKVALPGYVTRCKTGGCCRE